VRGSRLVGAFFSHGVLTIVQQGLNATAGVLIVRGLDHAEYAHYVIAFGMSSAIGILAEAGVISTLLRAGAHQDPEARDALIPQAVAFRRRTTVIASLTVLPFASVLLLRSGVAPGTLIALTALIVAGSFATAASQMSAALVRLDLRFTKAGSILVVSALARLGLTVMVILIPSGLRASYLLAVMATTGFLEVALFRSLTMGLALPIEVDRQLRAEFRRNARRIVPNNAFYLAQGQLLAWVLAGLGNVEILAEVAALGRFALLFALTAMVIANFTTTLFARQSTARGVARLMVLSATAYLAAGSALLGTFAAVPDLYLSILGDDYRGLAPELLLVNSGAMIGGLTGILSSVSQGRAWLKWAWIYIPATVVWLTVLALFIGFSTLERAALFTALAPATGLMSEIVMICTGFRREFSAPGPKHRSSQEAAARATTTN
jgi:O-antigen/teichoic acid export membrane protein